jgi:hypothetical protein
MPIIRILHSLARSGGTIVSRCLGCMDGVALLSEVHPTLGGEFNDPVRQAREWYGVHNLHETEFVDSIAEIAYRLEEQGKALVLRSWDHVDFVPCSHNRGKKIPRRSTLSEALRERFDLREVSLTRDMGDQFASLEKFGEPCNVGDLHGGRVAFEMQMSDSYTLGRVPIEEYENFVTNPERALRHICSALALPYDWQWEDKWHSYVNVTGDIENQRERRTIT